MARIRTIKPGFWKHEDLSALPAETHMLAAALLNYADDDGYFNANPVLVKSECLPLRELSGNVPGMLSELAGIGWIEIGRASDGKRYGKIVKFSEHQVISHKNTSKIKIMEIVWERSINAPGTIQEASHPEGNKEREEEGKNIGHAASPRRPIRVRNDLDGFDRFWTAWPNKTKRPAAEKAWPKALAAAGSIDSILAGVERYVRSKPGWQNWPHPATWLRNRQWDDEGIVEVPGSTDPHAEDRAHIAAWLKPSRNPRGIWTGRGPAPNEPGCIMPAVLFTEFAPDISRRAAEIAAAVTRVRAPGQASMLLPIDAGAGPASIAPAPYSLEIPPFLQRTAR